MRFYVCIVQYNNFFPKTMFFLNDCFFLIPEFFWISLVIAFLLFTTTMINKTHKILMQDFGYVYLYFIYLFGVVLLCVPSVEYSLLNYQYTNDQLLSCFKFVFLLMLAFCIYFSIDYFIKENVFFSEYFFLIGFFLVSSFFLVSAKDFLLFYLSIELQALILYTLAAFKRYNIFSAESGLKYFVLGAFASGLLLFGISLFYGFLGILNFYDMKFFFLKWLGVEAYFGISSAILFIFVALLFKLAAAPFHIWVPDVYEGAPTVIVLLFASLPKLAVFTFLVKFYILFFHEMSGLWYTVFFFSGMLSVLWGTFSALNQLNIKRLYAYSAIVNVGYILTSLAYGTLENLVASLNFLVVYLLSTLSFFAVILMFRESGNLRKLKYIGDYKSYLSYSSLLAILFSLVFFSMAGVPPLAGFFIKFFLFKAIFTVDFLLNPIFFVILVTSVISTLYYIRIVRFIFFDKLVEPTFFRPVNIIFCFLFIFIIIFLLIFAVFQPIVLLHISNLIELSYL